MIRKSARRGRGKIESEAGERQRIRQSMFKWEVLDEPGRRLGRGLGRTELIGRVAREVGQSLREVQSALKRGSAQG